MNPGIPNLSCNCPHLPEICSVLPIGAAMEDKIGMKDYE